MFRKTVCISIVLIFCLFACAYAARLVWNANTEPDLAGYKVYRGQSSGSYDHVVDVGNVTEHQIEGLNPGTYFYSVTAYNTSGAESGFSNEVIYAESPQAIAPATDINVAWQEVRPMGFSYIAGLGAYQNASGTSLSLASTFNVAAHDVLVAWVHWEDGDGGTIAISDGGSNNFTMESVSNDTYNYGCFGLLLDAVANATATFTFTNSIGRIYRGLGVMQFRPDVGDIIAKDQSAVGNGSGTSLVSGNITTTGDDEIVLGAGKDYVGGSPFSAEQIGDINATVAIDLYTLGGIWYRILTATANNIHAQATANNGAWICNIISVKATVAAGGLSIPVAMDIYRQRRN